MYKFIDDPLIWADINGFSAFKIDAGIAMDKWHHPTNDYFNSVDSFLEKNYVGINVKNCMALLFVWPSGDIRTDILSLKTNTLLTSKIHRNYLPSLNNKCHISNFDANTGVCDIDVSVFNHFISLKDKEVFVGGQPNYGHWLCDYLPNCIVASQLGYSVVSVCSTATHLDTLEFFNVRSKLKLPPLVSNLAINLCDNVILTRPPTSIIPSIYRAFYARPALQGGVYIDKPLGFQRVGNRVGLMTYLSKAGYEIVNPLACPFHELVAKISSSSHVIVPFGAGLPNIFFSDPEASVSVLINKEIINSRRFDLAMSLNPLIPHPSLRLIYGVQTDPSEDPLNASCIFDLSADFLKIQ